jgi:hypothetical protein
MNYYWFIDEVKDIQTLNRVKSMVRKAERALGINEDTIGLEWFSNIDHKGKKFKSKNFDVEVILHMRHESWQLAPNGYVNYLVIDKKNNKAYEAKHIFPNPRGDKTAGWYIKEKK